MDLQDLDLEELSISGKLPAEEVTYDEEKNLQILSVQAIYTDVKSYETSPAKNKLRIEFGKLIAMDRINSAEATRIFMFLDCYKFVAAEKQQVHKKLSEWVTDWLYSWSSRFCNLSNYPHSFLYRASMACMTISHFYSWDEQEILFQELNGKEFPDCTH